jgi:3-hydroxyisobutyrate dehydrogenase-like beta-hydroxyacid dehydrogenase
MANLGWIVIGRIGTEMALLLLRAGHRLTPVSGSPGSTLAVFLGGAAADGARVRPWIASYARTMTHALLARRLPADTVRNLTRDRATMHDMARTASLPMPLNDAVSTQFRQVFDASPPASEAETEVPAPRDL